MLVKGITDEDFVNYKVPSMFICTNTCSFKCDRECGKPICQNSELAKQPSIDVDMDSIIKRFLWNPIPRAIVFGGLEPFDQFVDIYDFIFKLRIDYSCNDDIVIYTGYDKHEIQGKIMALIPFCNIIVKFGRFKPDEYPHFDPILGVNLASDNQYAEQIS